MNERIVELAEKAGLEYNFDPMTWLKHKKFAELIVEECVRYFNQDYHRDWSTLWREDLSKGIKQHFGVED